MQPFKKVVRVGTQKERNNRGNEVDADIFCKIEYRANKDAGKLGLSISGVIGPKPDGSALGGCGQICISSMTEIANITPAPKWTHETIKQFMDIWDEWHLNYMNAATPEMKAAGWEELARKEIFKYCYIISTAARDERNAIERECVKAALEGRGLVLDDRQKRLLTCETSPEIYAYETPETPEFMEPWKNDGRHKIERKTLGWVRPSEHPDGLLGRELNGFKYGCAWYYEAVPEEALQWLQALPDTDKTPAWV